MTGVSGGRVRLTMLNSMAGDDFPLSLDRQKSWGVADLDLKDRIFGCGVLELTDTQARRAAQMIADRGQRVWCMSTQLFHDAIEKGEAHFRDHHLARVGRAVELADILRPHFIRLLSATTERRAGIAGAPGRLAREAPWLAAMYRQAIDRIASGGHLATIENETGGNILSNPAEVAELFELLDRPGKVSFTWDAQNMWQVSGQPPSVAIYDAMPPVLRFVHLKGGVAGPDGRLQFRSSLADASWPVLDVVRRVVADGCSEVICLNPSHGPPPPGQGYVNHVEADMAFLREHVAGIV
ncbi:MAG: hypothetical protein BIFFINMI_04406 [Phycisphaerae bacterium]|nr:hypothetical protein [Phycisphaerae bacterium]